MLRVWGKCLWIAAIGLAVAVIGYPLLHEAGHVLAALAVGARVVSVHLLPTPHVVCDMADVSALGIAAVGLGGICLPSALALMLRPRSFGGWYAVLLLRGIGVLACALSLIAVVLYAVGIPLPQEDVVQVIAAHESSAPLLFALLLVLGVATVRAIRRDRPMRRILAYADMPPTTA